MLVRLGQLDHRHIDAERLESVGFTIIASGPAVDAVRPEIAAAVGVDLVVMRAADAERTMSVVGDLHVFPNTSAAPVLILAASADMTMLKQEFRDNIRVKISRARVSEEEFNNSVDEVMLRASGGRMTEAESEAYAIEAIMTLRDDIRLFFICGLLDRRQLLLSKLGFVKRFIQSGLLK